MIPKLLKEQEETIHQAIQSCFPDAVEGGVLTAWVVVAEWMDSKGEKWLSWIRPRETLNMTTWLADGMLKTALDDGWGVEEEEEA